jgi:hypothetical protein
MKKFHRARLLTLAAFLDTLPRVKFDFDVFVREDGLPMKEALKAGDHDCGTAGCAVGWLPAVFPRAFKWECGTVFGTTWNGKNIGPPANLEAARQWFGLRYPDADTLFLPNTCGGSLGVDATPKQVADHIRTFVKEQEELMLCH